MPSQIAQAGRAPSGFVHQASIYGSDEEFVAMALPFVECGLALGDPVLAATTSANLKLLRQALGTRAYQVDHVDSRSLGARPPERLTALHRYWRQHTAPGRGMRILAEPTWTDRSAQEVRALHYLESDLNAILAATAIRMICPYDTRVTDPDIVAEARRTHPELVVGATTQTSPSYADPERYRAEGDPTRPPPPHDRPPVTRHFTAEDLSAVRHEATEYANRLRLPPSRGYDLAIAAGEIAANAVEHGAGHGTLRLWTEHDELLCEVTDEVAAATGWRPLHPFAGYLPGRWPLDSRGRGLWLTRQLCDLVEIHSDNGRTTLRMHLTMHL